METTYVLVDFENVQPRNIDALSKYEFDVFVFVGANQSKVPLGLATSMQKLGKRGRYLQITGTGRNALDFHIAFYLGELSATEHPARFYLISRDKGFDPLIKHLNSRKIRVVRYNDIAEIQELRISTTKSLDEKIAAIVRNLAGRHRARPRKLKTLTNAIGNLFTGRLEESELERLVEELRAKRYIKVDEKGNVSYRLPKSS
jgi:hypothetical protein